MSKIKVAGERSFSDIKTLIEYSVPDADPTRTVIKDAVGNDIPNILYLAQCRVFGTIITGKGYSAEEAKKEVEEKFNAVNTTVADPKNYETTLEIFDTLGNFLGDTVVKEAQAKSKAYGIGKDGLHMAGKGINTYYPPNVIGKINFYLSEF